MKLTEDKLRKIIREEASKLQESSAAGKLRSKVDRAISSHGPEAALEQLLNTLEFSLRNSGLENIADAYDRRNDSFFSSQW